MIRVYETVVKGNFIDNLIKAEKERVQAEQYAAEMKKAAAERAALQAEQKKANQTALEQAVKERSAAKQPKTAPKKHRR